MCASSTPTGSHSKAQGATLGQRLPTAGATGRITGYRSQCAICELPIPALLVASHIIPWSVDPALRMNPQNGICLCTLHDRAFDRGLLTIRDNFTIALAPLFDTLTHLRPITDSFLRFRDLPLHLPERWHPDPALLFLEGGPSHIDLFDLKPEADANHRGEFQPIATKTPGVQVCDQLPLLSQQMHHVAQIRLRRHAELTGANSCAAL
jgi:hypothetical protein